MPVPRPNLDLWKAQLAPGASFLFANQLFDIALPAGVCDLQKADWKNGQYANGGSSFRLKDGSAGADSFQSVVYGDANGDGQLEAIVELANRPPYTGGSGVYMIGTDDSLVFTMTDCKVTYVSTLPRGSATFKPGMIEVAGNTTYQFALNGKRLQLREAGAQTTKVSKSCSNLCTFNARCDPLSSKGVFGNCCDSVAGPQFAAECRRRRGD